MTTGSQLDLDRLLDHPIRLVQAQGEGDLAARLNDQTDRLIAAVRAWRDLAHGLDAVKPKPLDDTQQLAYALMDLALAVSQGESPNGRIEWFSPTGEEANLGLDCPDGTKLLVRGVWHVTHNGEAKTLTLDGGPW